MFCILFQVVLGTCSGLYACFRNTALIKVCLDLPTERGANILQRWTSERRQVLDGRNICPQFVVGETDIQSARTCASIGVCHPYHNDVNLSTVDLDMSLRHIGLKLREEFALGHAVCIGSLGCLHTARECHN